MTSLNEDQNVLQLDERGRVRLSKERWEALGIAAGMGPEPGAYRSARGARPTMIGCSEVPFPRWRLSRAT